MAVRSMKLGAVDFIEKPYTNQDLVDRVNRAIEQDRQLRQGLRSRAAVEERLAQLTRRENQVLEGVLEGKASKVIAGDLELSHKTIDVHRSHVLEKMGVNSLAELMRVVLEHRARKPTSSGNEA